MEPNRLKDRILIWTEEEIRAGALPPQSTKLLSAILYLGEIERGELPDLLGVTPRHARRVSKALLDRGVLTSKSPKLALNLAFPAALAGRWMPGLFPEQINQS